MKIKGVLGGYAAKATGEGDLLYDHRPLSPVALVTKLIF